MVIDYQRLIETLFMFDEKFEHRCELVSESNPNGYAVNKKPLLEQAS